MSSLIRPSTSPQRSPLSAQYPSHGYKPASNKFKSAGIPPHNFDKSPSSSTSVPKQAQNNLAAKDTNILKEDTRQELLVMTIDLGDGSKDLLRVQEGDDPFDLAVDFCEKHGLSNQLVEPLAQNIYINMEHVLEESVQTLDMVGGSHNQDGEADVRGGSDTNQQTGKFKNLGDLAQEAESGNRSRSEQQRLAYQGQGNEEDRDGEDVQQYKDEHEIIEEEYSLDKFQDGERLVNKSATIPRNHDEMYEMADHEENLEEKPVMMRPNSTGSLVEHRVSENEQRGSRKTLENNREGQRNHPRQEVRGYDSSIQFNAQDNRRINGDQLHGKHFIKPLSSGQDLQNEEEYLDYLITNQYGENKEKSQEGRYELSFVPNISQTSKQISANKSQGEKVSVYERLHNQAMLKNSQKAAAQAAQQSQMTKKSNTSIAHSVASQSQVQDINYGTLLYHRGLKKNEETQKHLVERRKDKLEELNKECTFKPDLSRISQQIMSTKARVEDVSDKLIKAGRNAQEKIERARSVKVNQELEQCTFRPEVNVISQKIDEEKVQMTANSPPNRCLKLFEESSIRRKQQEIAHRTLPSDYTFKPATNNYNSTSLSQMTFEQRERKFQDRLERIKQLRQLKEESEVRDLETGEPLFKPKTGRAPKDGRNIGSLPVGDRLYNQQYRIADTKKKLLEQNERALEATKAKSNEKSQAIVENLMIRRLEEIFRKFDSDGDGLISSSKIDITPVPTEILETLAPLLCEMEEQNQVLDFPTFVAEADGLLKTLTVTERNNLLLGKRENNNEPQYTFKPSIDKKSQKLAQKKHPYGDFNSLYGSYIDERKKTEAKIKEKQEQKEQEELAACSFKPKLITQAKSATSASTSKIYFENDFIL